MEVEQRYEQIIAPRIVTALLSEFNAVTDYCTLRDSLPRRLVNWLKCRCVLLYQRIGETLQFAAGSFDDKPGWSSSLLAVAHINPISLNSEIPEACAWRERHAICVPLPCPTLVAMPLIYRQRGIGVLVVIRGKGEEKIYTPDCWTGDEVEILEAVAGIVALLLENTHLLERDRERIHELSLLNSISSQMAYSMCELERVRSVVIQRAKEISTADMCEVIELSTPPDAVTWITPMLREMLFQRFREQRSLSPLVIERPGDLHDQCASDYLNQLPVNIKTFFVVPLFSARAIGRQGGSLLRGGIGTAYEITQEPKVLGILVGGYYRAWKLRRTETVLLQVLASQASAVLENIHLMSEVVDARNEARKLLRQVLDDQHFKELILANIPSGLITTDREGCITTFNRAAEAILGYDSCEVLGQPLHKFLNLQYRANSYALTSHQTRHASVVQGMTVITVDRHGHEVVLDVNVLPLYDDVRVRIGTLATFMDVTSVHRLEEEKRRLDRLASLGEMAANVAHEVRNPLASVKTSMQMLMDDLVGGELSSVQDFSLAQGRVQTNWVQESISVALEEVERLDTIVRDLLLFAKPRQLHRVKCNLVELSNHVLNFIQMQCLEANVVVHRIYEEVPPVWVDVAQIEQVLLNLYMNAVQAMPDGGILTVSCQCISTESMVKSTKISDVVRFQEIANDALSKPFESLTEENKSSDQQWLEIAVSDTGVGIAPDQLEHIFQPFYTTKAHGIGLGLAITRRLVEDHGGFIRVEGHFGYGATLSVRLPLAPHGEISSQEDENEGDVWESRGKV